MNTLLVVGSAPCLLDDVKRALELRPLAALMLVNGACTVIEQAEHVLAGHTDKAELFAAARRKAFPNAQPWQLHATIFDKHLAEAKKELPSVTNWWDKSYCNGATSIAKGAVIGLRGLGFGEVILCGAPMDGSGYVPGEAVVPHERFCIRVGDPSAHSGWGLHKTDRHRTVDSYRRRFKDKFAPAHKGRVFSMSGFTRDCLGEAPR